MRITLPDDTLVIHAGEFGQQVIELLDTSPARLIEADGPVYTASIPYATTIISVWSGHRPEDRDRIDSVAFARGIPRSASNSTRPPSSAAQWWYQVGLPATAAADCDRSSTPEDPSA